MADSVKKVHPNNPGTGKQLGNPKGGGPAKPQGTPPGEGFHNVDGTGKPMGGKAPHKKAKHGSFKSLDEVKAYRKEKHGF